MAVKAIKSGEFPVSAAIAQQRSFMRTCLESEMKEIDDLVNELIG